jgi:hypothetical protein
MLNLIRASLFAALAFFRARRELASRSSLCGTNLVCSTDSPNGAGKQLGGCAGVPGGSPQYGAMVVAHLRRAGVEAPLELRVRCLEEAGALRLSPVCPARQASGVGAPRAARRVGGAEVGGGPRGAQRSGGGCDQPSEKGKNHRLLQLVILLRASANARPAGTELHAWLV